MRTGKKEYTKEQSQRNIFGILAVFMVLLPVSRVISYPLRIGDSMIVTGIFMMFFFLFSIVKLAREIRCGMVPWRQLLLPYGCLMIPWVLSFITAFRVTSTKAAFIGTYERSEGLLQTGAYVGVFLMVTMLQKRDYRRGLIYVFLGIVSIISPVGMVQFSRIFGSGELFSGVASFPIGNQNFYASLMVLFAGVAMAGVWLYEEKSALFHPTAWWKRGIWITLSVLSYIGCIASKSSSAHVGIFIMLLFLVFLDLIGRRKCLRWVAFLFVLYLAVGFVLNILSGGRIWQEFIGNFIVIKEEGSLFADKVGTSRMKIWKDVIGLLPTYWLFGCGVENLGYVYLKVYGRDAAGRFSDKAHNEYLDIWISEGIVSLVLYLVLLFYLFIPGVLQYRKESKYETDDVSKVAVIPFLGYLAQAFFNVRMASVAPYFWIICGLLCVKGKMKNNSCVAKEETWENQS